MIDWAAAYIGIPFGGGAGQVTCWGLVRRVYAEILGVELPVYGEVSASDLARIARTMGAEKDGERWHQVGSPRVFDVCLMHGPAGGRAIVHVGVMIDRVRLLHVEEASASVVVPVADFRIRGRVAGYRRYVA